MFCGMLNDSISGYGLYVCFNSNFDKKLDLYRKHKIISFISAINYKYYITCLSYRLCNLNEMFDILPKKLIKKANIYYNI